MFGPKAMWLARWWAQIQANDRKEADAMNSDKHTSSGKTDVDAIAEALGLVDYAEGQGPHYGSAPECLARIAEMKARHELISRRENELHYAIRRDANILDHKLTEEEAHQTALKKAEAMHAELDMLHCTAGSGHRG